MPVDGKGKYHMNSQQARSADKMSEPKPKGDEAAGESMDEGGEKTHTITEHGDGSFTSHMHGGAEEKHPDHLHMMAHVGHHVTGGDKHMIHHHDGMAMHSHGIHESGEHQDTQDHNTAEEAKQALGNFLDEEAQEPAHQHEGEPAAIGGGY